MYRSRQRLARAGCAHSNAPIGSPALPDYLAAARSRPNCAPVCKATILVGSRCWWRAGKCRAQRLLDHGQRQQFRGGQQRAQHHHIGQTRLPRCDRQGIGRDGDDRDIFPFQRALHQRGVDHQQPTGPHQRLIFIGRGQIHGHHHVGVAHQGRADRLISDHHGAMGGAAPHLRPVGRDPGDMFARVDRGVGEQLPGEQGALSAKTGKNDRLFHDHTHLKPIRGGL